MGKELKVGMKIKQIKPIEDYGFNYVGQEFTITDIRKESVLFTYGSCGKGGIEKNKIYDYFEIVENEPEIKLDTKVEIIGGIFKNSELQGKVVATSNIKSNTKTKYKIELKDGNYLILKKEDIKPLKITKKVYETNRMMGKEKYDCLVKINGKRTTVKLSGKNGEDAKGSVYCNKKDTFSEEEGVRRAFLKAIINKLESRIKK